MAFSDDFTGTGSLNGRHPTVSGTPDTTNVWTLLLGTDDASVSGGVLQRMTGTSASVFYGTGNDSTTTQQVKMDLNVATNASIVVLGSVSGGTFSGYTLQAQTGLTAVRINRVNGNTKTALATISGLANTNVVELHSGLDGSGNPVLSFYQNGSPVGSPVTDNSASKLTSGQRGVWISSNTSIADIGDNYSDNYTAPSSVVITITEPLAGWVYDGVYASSAFSIPVSWTGAPTAIDARLVDGTGTAVTGFDWATKIASPAANSSGSVSFTGVPVGGSYFIQVRDPGTSTVKDGLNNFFVGLDLPYWGRSQTTKLRSLTSDPLTPTAGIKASVLYLSSITTPGAQTLQQLSAGAGSCASGVVAWANQWWADTGVPIMLRDCSYPGVTIEDFNNDISLQVTYTGLTGTFQVGETVTQGAVSGVVSAVTGTTLSFSSAGSFTTGAITGATSGATATVTSTWNLWTGVVTTAMQGNQAGGMIWLPAETGSTVLNAAWSTDADTLKGKFNALISGRLVTIGIVPHLRANNGDYTDDLRNVMYNKAVSGGQYALATFCSDHQCDADASPHQTTGATGNQRIGTRLGRASAALFSNPALVRFGPTVTSCVFTDATNKVIEVTFDRNIQTPSAITSGIEGVCVSTDGGSTFTHLTSGYSVAISGANKIRVTNTSGAWTVGSTNIDFLRGIPFNSLSTASDYAGAEATVEANYLSKIITDTSGFEGGRGLPVRPSMGSGIAVQNYTPAATGRGWFARRSNIHHRYVPASAVAVAYDYIISTDADWATVLTALAATTTNKTVGVAPGNYTAKTIALDGGAGIVTFKATASGARVDKLTIGAGSRNLVVDGLELVSSDWNSNPTAACTISGSQSRDLTIQNCTILGNYQGTVDFALDATSDNYSAYAAINPSGFDTNGGITGLTIQNSYVGDILTDQTNLALTDSGAQSGATGFTGLVDVVGGHLTNARVSTAGTGYVSAGDSAIITWAGQHPMKTYQPFGIQAGSGYAATGAVTIQNNTFRLCNSACKFSPTTGALTIKGNTFDLTYEDTMSFGHASDNTAPPSSTVIAFNFAKRNLTKVGDPGDPHPDYIQLFMNNISAPYTPSDWHVEIYGNVYFDGGTRGYNQGIFMCNNPTGIYYVGRVVGNFHCDNTTTIGVQADRCKDLYVYKNTCVRYNTADPNNASAVKLLIALDDAGENFFGSNIFEADSFSAKGNTYAAGYANVVLGQNGATIPYANVFATPNSAMSTLADAVADFATVAGYLTDGAFSDTAYIDHINKTIDRTREPALVYFAPASGQAVNTSVSSAWCKIEGGPDTVAISGMTGGSWQVADDSSGTNATVATSANGSTTRGKYLRLNQTSSPSNSTTTTASVSLNGTVSSFDVTTVSAINYTAIDNQVTAWSKIAQPSSQSGLSRMLIALQVRTDSLVSGSYALGSSTGSTLGLFMPSGTQWRFQLVSSAALQYRQTTIPPQAGATQTHLIAIDFTQNTQAGVCKWWINGVDVGAPATGSSIDVTATRTFDIATIFSTAGLGVFNNGGGTGPILDGAIDFLWIDYGNSTYSLPDITSSTVRNKFTADNINLTDGSGVTGSQPKFFYPGASNLTAWNDTTNGVPNRGSVASRPLIKQAGTYA